MRNCTLFSCNSTIAKTFDCELYLQALEEQADSIGRAANGMLQAMETFKENAESVLRSVDNLKKMIGMTRRAMNLVHGGRVVERVEVERESTSSTPTEEDLGDRPANNYLPEAENLDEDANEPSYTIEGRNLVIPAYITVRRVLWCERCAACGGRPLRCACST